MAVLLETGSTECPIFQFRTHIPMARIGKTCGEASGMELDKVCFRDSVKFVAFGLGYISKNLYFANEK